MAKKPSKLIGKKFYALIGEAVVEFGRLENELRDSLVEIVCPAIGYPTNLALFARTKFSDLTSLYEFMVLYALQHCEGEGCVSADRKGVITSELRELKTRLLSVNERRNTLVHSTYLETEHFDDCESMPSDLKLEALKPFLSRRALDDHEDFHSEGIREIGYKLIADIRAACQEFLTFDHSVARLTNQMWKPFCAWLSARDTDIRYQDPEIKISF